MKGLVGGPLLVGGLGPGLPGLPLNPALIGKQGNFRIRLCPMRLLASHFQYTFPTCLHYCSVNMGQHDVIHKTGSAQEDRTSHGHSNTHRKCGEVWTCGFRDMMRSYLEEVDVLGDNVLRLGFVLAVFDVHVQTSFLYNIVSCYI